MRRTSQGAPITVAVLLAVGVLLLAAMSGARASADEPSGSVETASEGTVSHEALNGIPVRVVSAEVPAEEETPEGHVMMDARHRELTERSPAASHLVVGGSDHLSLVTHADYASEVAAIVVGVLRELTEQ